jgi:glycosyltransferase involved in cell wall biosynthesis
MKKVKQSLIVSFFNGVAQLQMIIKALERQSDLAFEVLIADDGSNARSVSQVQEIIEDSPLKIKHLWHENDGFRKVIILNRAVLESSSDYLVFIDGDCIPHKEFMRGHYQSREEGCFLAGRRINLSEGLSRKLSTDKIGAGFLETSFKKDLLLDGLFGKTTHFEKGFYVGNKTLQTVLNRKHAGLLGCNFSVFKQDLVAINGFDERYLAPAIGEDSDIEYRLLLNGIKSKTVKNIAIVYHLYHKKLERENLNRSIFDEVIKKQQIVTPFGIKKISTNL